MKTMKCDACDASFEAESFGEWVEKTKPHYGEMHKEMMEQAGQGTPEEQQQKLQEWMGKMQAEFEAL